VNNAQHYFTLHKQSLLMVHGVN